MESKQNLRKEYITIRNNIKNKKEKSNIIMEKLIKEEAYLKAKIIALYKNFTSEVDTNELIEYSILNKKIIVLPKVVENDLKFYKISLDEKFTKSGFGVEEPEGKEDKFITKEKIDLVIVPGICFDRKGNRIGYGKGYYDRFLANTNLNTIALCFKEQIVEKIPDDKNDIRIKKIITD